MNLGLIEFFCVHASYACYAEQLVGSAAFAKLSLRECGTVLTREKFLRIEKKAMRFVLGLLEFGCETI